MRICVERSSDALSPSIQVTIAGQHTDAVEFGARAVKGCCIGDDSAGAIAELRPRRLGEQRRGKRLVERAGGGWRLVYLRADEATLRARLAERAGRFDANATFPIPDEILTRFLGCSRRLQRKEERSSSFWAGRALRPMSRAVMPLSGLAA